MCIKTVQEMNIFARGLFDKIETNLKNFKTDHQLEQYIKQAIKQERYFLSWPVNINIDNVIAHKATGKKPILLKDKKLIKVDLGFNDNLSNRVDLARTFIKDKENKQYVTYLEEYRSAIKQVEKHLSTSLNLEQLTKILQEKLKDFWICPLFISHYISKNRIHDTPIPHYKWQIDKNINLKTGFFTLEPIVVPKKLMFVNGNNSHKVKYQLLKSNIKRISREKYVHVYQKNKPVKSSKKLINAFEESYSMDLLNFFEEKMYYLDSDKNLYCL